MLKQRPGKTDPDRKITFTNWLKALALSPGILFPTGYLVIYFLTNSYLNREFKENISLAIEAATDNRYTLSIEHLRAGLDLHSVTLQHLELNPVEKQHQTASGNSVSIRQLCVEPINLCNLLFSKQTAERSTRKISQRILDTNKLLVFSSTAQ